MAQQIGVVGLAVMGKNLAWNIESRGYNVAVYNRSSEKTDEMVKESEGKNIHPTYSIEEFVNSLEKPRKILLMVKVGPATDKTIDSLLPLLDNDDILIDGGNTNYQDTIRRNTTGRKWRKLYRNGRIWWRSRCLNWTFINARRSKGSI